MKSEFEISQVMLSLAAWLGG